MVTLENLRLSHVSSFWAGLSNPLIPRFHPKNRTAITIWYKETEKSLSQKTVQRLFLPSRTMFLPQYLLKPILPRYQLLLPPFVHLWLSPSVPLNPLVSPFNTSALPPLLSAPARPFLSHSSPLVPCNCLRFKSFYLSRGSQIQKRHSVRSTKLIGSRVDVLSTHIGFGDARWLLGFIHPSPEIWSTVSIGLYFRGKDIFKVSSTDTGKDASALLLSKLLQFAPSARNTIFIKCQNEARIRVISFIWTSEFYIFVFMSEPWLKF